MDEGDALRYHAEAFALLGHTPRASPEAVGAITAWESEHGARLPASVREFYAHEGDKLRLGSSRDWCIVPLAGFLRAMKDAASHGSWVYSSWRPFYLPGEPKDQGEKPTIDHPVCIISDPFCNMDYQVDLVLDGSDDPWGRPNMPIDPDGPFSSFILALARRKQRQGGGEL
jgi:hypothetical protein